MPALRSRRPLSFAELCTENRRSVANDASGVMFSWTFEESDCPTEGGLASERSLETNLELLRAEIHAETELVAERGHLLR